MYLTKGGSETVGLWKAYKETKKIISRSVLTKKKEKQDISY